MVSASWDEVRARRLERCSLIERARADQLVRVVRDLGGVHAQVQASAELQLAVRVDEITQADVREALWERRVLVKAWTRRGTLHLHPAGELALWYAARRALVDASADDHLELEAWRDPAGVLHAALGRDDVEAIRAAVWDALDGRCLLRDELAEEVVKRVGPGPRQRLLSGFAFFLDELCQGPPQGAKVTFVRPDQWVDGWQEVREQDALVEVCRRFLRRTARRVRVTSGSGSRRERSRPATRARCSMRSAMSSKRSTSKVIVHTFSRETQSFPRRSRAFGCFRSTTSTSWASASASTLFRRR